MRFAFFLGFLTLAAGCIVEDKPITQPNDGGVDAGELCGSVSCPADRPLCSDALECVQCTASEDAYCTDQGLLCNTVSMTCIACSGDADCTDPTAARCIDEMCTACDDRAQCDDVDGLPGVNNACNDGGACVDCTPESETETCPGFKACNPQTEKCTETQVGSLDVCEECVADSECGDDGEESDAFRCVPMYYPNQETRFPNSDAGFCLKTTAGGCEQPYSITLPSRASLSGAEPAGYCGIEEDLTTCPAVNALVVENEGCPSGADDECPVGGICRDLDNFMDRCTYLCDLPAQCPAGAPADTCGSSGAGGAGGKYCGGG